MPDVFDEEHDREEAPQEPAKKQQHAIVPHRVTYRKARSQDMSHLCIPVRPLCAEM